MRWLKWYGVDWINSTARDELTPAERSTFVDFVCLASFPGSPLGTFKFASLEALARKLNTPLEVIVSTRDKCSENRIAISQNSEGYIMTILNWEKYQALAFKGGGDNRKSEKPPKSDNKSAPQIRLDKIRKETPSISPPRGEPPPLPDWLEKATWNDFLEMRRKKRATPTPRAQHLLLKKLADLKGQGHDPDKVLQQSIMNSWTGLFPLKEDYHGEYQRHPQEVPGNRPAGAFADLEERRDMGGRTKATGLTGVSGGC